MSRTETIRMEILTQLYGFRPAARDADRMAAMAKREGELPDATPGEFVRECGYLVGKKLIEADPEELAQNHQRWKITSAGIDHLEKRGLV